MRFILALVLALPAFNTFAATIFARTIFDPLFAGGTGIVDDLKTGSGPQSAAANGTGGFGSSGGGATGVDWGVINTAGSITGPANLIGHGEWRDSIIITAPGIAAGTFGTLSYGILLGEFWGVGGAPGNAVSTYTVRSDLGGGAFDIGLDGTFFNDSPCLATNGIIRNTFGTPRATVSFQYGFATQLNVQIRATAQGANCFSPVQAVASFDHKVYWDGINSLTANGIPINNFNITSESGTDWRRSFVPPSNKVSEPASLMLLALGLACGALGLRRQTALPTKSGKLT